MKVLPVIGLRALSLIAVCILLESQLLAQIPSNPLRANAPAPVTAPVVQPQVAAKPSATTAETVAAPTSAENNSTGLQFPVRLASHAQEPRTFVPQYSRQSTSVLISEDAPRVAAAEGETVVQEHVEYQAEEMMEGTGCDGCGGRGCGGCGGCDGNFCGMGLCSDGCLIPCPVFSLKNLQFNVGVHGATGPVNRGETGSFGFQEGFNWGAPMPCGNEWGLGTQFGMQAIQSNLSGASYSDKARYQVFLTAGIFRRVDWGLQGGVVIDYLREDWYFEGDFTAVRGELSWVEPGSHELGFWFTSQTKTQMVQSTILTPAQQTMTETWGAKDLYAFFYRQPLNDCGANCRIYAGFTGTNDGLIGSDIRMPINDRWSVESEFIYLIPEESRGAGGHLNEAWNVAINFVYYPGCRTATGNDYYRPLFNVANNGTFILDNE